MKNEILSEVWQNRDEFAKRYNYDLNAIVATLQEMESHPWNVIVDRRKETPNKKNEPDGAGYFCRYTPYVSIQIHIDK